MKRNLLQAIVRFRIAILLFLAMVPAVARLGAQETFVYAPSDENFLNPERGLYGFSILTNPPSTYYQDLRASGLSLAYAAIYLDCCRTSAIDQALLDTIEENLNRMRLAGVKGILRILYDDGGGNDASLVWMEAHLQQLEPIFDANKDIIAFFQAGMIGAYGEWHTSSNGLDTPAGRAAVWDLANDYFPACIPIQVRTPAFVYELEGDDLPLIQADAFSCTPPARLGHHNDCWLASATDFGTYASAADREGWLTALEHDTLFVPWGGETCALSALSDCATALSEAARLHATYLNRDYNPDVIAALAPCWSTIQKKLGYRFELIQAEFPAAMFSGEVFDYRIDLKNTGWAPMYRERPVYLRIFLPTQPITVLKEYRLDTDPRFWSPQAGTITLAGSLIAPMGVQAGVDVALWLPDLDPGLQSRADYAVRFANTGVWQSQNGHNLLAEAIPIGPAQGAMATLASNQVICQGESASIHVALTGAPPWSLSWSDGFMQSNVLTSPATRVVSPNTTIEYTISAVSDQNGAGTAQGSATVEVRIFDVAVTPGVSIAQGLATIVLDAQATCGEPVVTIEWRNLNAGTSFGLGVNPVALVPQPATTTDYQVTVIEGQRQATQTRRVRVLVSSNPQYFDFNGDGCNTLEDLAAFWPEWSNAAPADPNGDGIIDVRDFQYINTSDPEPCGG